MESVLPQLRQLPTQRPVGVANSCARTLSLCQPLTRDMHPREVAMALKAGEVLQQDASWASWENVITAHQQLASEFLEQLAPYPQKNYTGRGIVICAGGPTFFTNAWVCMRILRQLDCDLPIQFWHLPGECNVQMADLVRPFDVQCVNASDIADPTAQRPRTLRGWELKAFALLHSPFQQVLLLDADNVAVRNPGDLFETEQFLNAGTIFWPDYGRLAPDRSIWRITEVSYRDEYEVESGQIVLDKSRCWAALNLAMHYNEHSDFYYVHIHGDKCTFQLAWHRTHTPFAMPPFPIHSLDATMCQHDFQGRRIFQHRNMDKWRLDGQNRAIDDFVHESECREFLADLRERWSGEVSSSGSTKNAEEFFSSAASRRFLYRRVGHDTRPLELKLDGSIGEGQAAYEESWHVTTNNELALCGAQGVTCLLRPCADGVYRGRWLRHERMPIELAPMQHLLMTDPVLTWEPWLSPFIGWGEGWAVDVGANHGVWTRSLARRYRQVIALEPQAALADALNAAGLANVTVIQQGAWAHSGVMEFNLHDGDGHSCLAACDHVAGSTAVRDKVAVPVVALDAILENTKVDFIKMDVEGAEIFALEGLRSTILEQRPQLLIECHSPENAAWVQCWLDGLGYAITRIHDPFSQPGTEKWLSHVWIAARIHS